MLYGKCDHIAATENGIPDPHSKIFFSCLALAFNYI